MQICIVETSSLGPAQRDKSLLNIRREFPCVQDGEHLTIRTEDLKLAFEIVRWSNNSSLVLYDGEVIRAIYKPEFPNKIKQFTESKV